MVQKVFAFLGSTGSIGTQAASVCQEHGFQVAGLACHQNLKVLLEQIQIFHPKCVAVGTETLAVILREQMQSVAFRAAFVNTDPSMWFQSDLPEVFWGDQGYRTVATIPAVHCVLAAMVGFAGLSPVLEAISAGKDIALANKETLVTAGPLILEAVRKQGVHLLPVDSEHSAIWQCIRKGDLADVKRIFLTASGGPFRTYSPEQLEQLTPKEALSHPTWKMGSKITVDSATLMNKGLEVIEAAHLFSLTPEQITVVVHPQSIIHSLVEWKSGSVLAQMGFPDMRLPIQEAFTYPQMQDSVVEPWNPFDSRSCSLTFEPPRREVFPFLDLAYSALAQGGYAPTWLNAVNETAVEAFLDGTVRLGTLLRTVIQVVAAFPAECNRESLSLSGIMEVDCLARNRAKEYLACQVS